MTKKLKEKPIVALVGRPNVGKSTLFNRLLSEKKAVISDIPGTTRDRLYANIIWRGTEFSLIDTGGLPDSVKAGMELASNKDFGKEVLSQIKTALKEADFVVFLVDIRGVLKQDIEVAKLVRKASKKVILVVNKVESPQHKAEIKNYYQLGLGEPFWVSALHGTNTGDLLDKIVEGIKGVRTKEVKETLPETKVAIIGRPNVGKSSLFNKLIKEERAIVSDIPGTTRDVIDSEIVAGKERLIFLDTAGIRRRGKIGRKNIEQYSVSRAHKAIERADIVLLLLDAVEGLTKQDMHVAAYAIEEKKGIILVVNKFDLVEGKISIDKYLAIFQRRLPFLSWAPVIFTSALTGKNTKKLFDLILKIKAERTKNIPVKEINSLVSKAILTHQPSRFSKKVRNYPKIYYSTQLKDTDFPTFVLMVNDASYFAGTYLKFIENQLREKYEFIGTPIKIILKSKKKDLR